MKNAMKPLIAGTAGLALLFSLAGCSGENQDYKDRKEQQKSITLQNSLEKRNLKEKLERENKPNAVRYLYLMSFGKIIGYYVIKGKVSSSGSQLAPEEDIVDPCSSSYCPTVVDSAQDDGTFGAGDDGVFFFLADGNMVETTLDYISSDNPLSIDVPRLEK